MLSARSQDRSPRRPLLVEQVGGPGGRLVMKSMKDEHLAILRRHMVEVIAIHVDLASDELGKSAFHPRVMAAMQKVPRHLFVPAPIALYAYQDTPLPIGFEKTVSQPFIAALMADLLEPEPDEVVLEVGTGLGYQAAILAELARQVWSVEVVEEFATEAETRLERFGVRNVGIRVGDGTRGWAEHAPFDKILVTAAAERAPPALLDQLKVGGRLVLPLGPAEAQVLTVIEKTQSGTSSRELIPVRFGQLETVM
jgi:protein-L-isoaspartate(D-aspartate) O-methyltransferase